jgi:hypothetical protein
MPISPHGTVHRVPFDYNHPISVFFTCGLHTTFSISFSVEIYEISTPRERTLLSVSTSMSMNLLMTAPQKQSKMTSASVSAHMNYCSLVAYVLMGKRVLEIVDHHLRTI